MKKELVFHTLKSCLLARGSHISFSVFPLTANRVVTIAISAQEKMKEKPTPLKQITLCLIFPVFNNIIPAKAKINTKGMKNTDI